jgi:hypothetical protein
MEIYHEPREELLRAEEEEEAEISKKSLAMAVYYSHKSFSPKHQFSFMQNAWGISSLARVEKLSDYIFKIEFNK